MFCRTRSSRHRSLLAVLLAGAVSSLVLLTGEAFALFVRDTWAPDGPVHAIVHSGNTIYLGGSFTQVGQPSGPAVAFDYPAAAPQKPFPNLVGQVRAVEPDGSGGWYLGGLFTSVRGEPRNNLAHIDANGALTPWNPDVNGEVDDIALTGGIVYVAGLFTSVGTATRNYVAAIDRITGVATPWDCSPNGPVTEIDTEGGAVYIGGTFTTVSGEAHQALAAVDRITAEPLFFPGTSDVTAATALEMDRGMVFYAVTTTTGTGYQLRLYDPTGTLPSFGTHNPNGPIYDISVSPSSLNLVMGGDFTSLNGGQPRQRLAVIQLSTSDLLPYNPGVDGPVRTVHWGFGFQDRILVGGSFGMVGGATRKNLAMLDWAGGVNAWNPGCGGQVWAVAQGFSRIFAGGDFSVTGSVTRSNLAAIDATSGVPLDWSPTTNAQVEALFVSGTTMYIGGQFSQVNGTGRNRAASVDAISGSLSPFNPNVDVSGATTVRAFARDGSTLYMAGAFGTVGGVSRVGVAAVDPTTGGLQAWNANVNGAVYAMGIIVPINLNPPTIFLGGQFTQAGGQARNNLAAISSSTGLANAWNPSPNAAVHSMVVLGTGLGGINRVYVGGAFSFIGGQPRSCLAWIDAAGAATPWAPNPNGLVYALAISGSNVVAAGAFTAIGGQPRNHIASVSLDSSLPIDWDPNTTGGIPAGYVYKLLRVNQTIYAGGTFTHVAATPRPHFVGIWEQTATAVEIEPTPQPASWVLRAAPNPFRFATTIRFSLASEGKTRVTVYDVSGRRVRELHDGWLPSGRHAMGWDGRDDTGLSTAAGIYFLGVRTDTEAMRSKVYRQ